MNSARSINVIQGLLLALTLTLSASSQAQSYDAPMLTNVTPPVVTIRAVDPFATGPSNPGIFTVFRQGDPVPALRVYYEIGGTARNGADYCTIGNWVYIPSGVRCSDVVIVPSNLVQTITKTVVLTLTNSPLMGPIGGSMPVNYIIGSPSSATVYIGSPNVTNVPPLVDIVQPLPGAVFFTPVDLPIVATARDADGFVRTVEFFANNIRLGIVTNPASILPPTDGILPPMPPYRPFVFVWSNAPAGTNIILTARATDNFGAPARSEPVNITIRRGPPPPPPSPTNFPPVVRITSPANNSVFRAPINLPLNAFAADRDGWVSRVDFFAGSMYLGQGQRVTPPASTKPLPAPSPIRLTNLWVFIWSNAPARMEPHPLTAVATDNWGARTRSEVIHVTILPEPPPPSLTNLVGIVATDPVAIEGTNCWPWAGLTGCTPTWDNWTASASVSRYFTNCGPKNALFTVRRLGSTNEALTVPYAIGGTATNGVHYVALSGTVSIPAGHRAAIIPLVPIAEDAPDITRTVILKLIPTGAYKVDPRHSCAAVIIIDGPPRRPVADLLPDRCFRINAAGPDGAWFRIECTTDLRTWVPICTNQVLGGSLDFIDPAAQSDQQRFYRAVSEPNAP